MLAGNRDVKPTLPSNRNIYGPLNPPPLIPSSSGDSPLSFSFSMDEMARANNNQVLMNNGLPRVHSFESGTGLGLLSKSSCSNDVFPLPIEVPEDVADVEAFRRYLSVRRGAIKAQRQCTTSFEVCFFQYSFKKFQA